MRKDKYVIYIDKTPVPVSEEVYREYKRAEEKEQYFMKRLKKGKVSVDRNGNIDILPAKEISLEQLIEKCGELPDNGESVEEQIVRMQLLECLEKGLKSLSDEELKLIREIFWLEKTERELGEAYQVSQGTIHKRKKAIIEKLRKFL